MIESDLIPCSVATSSYRPRYSRFAVRRSMSPPPAVTVCCLMVLPMARSLALGDPCSQPYGTGSPPHESALTGEERDHRARTGVHMAPGHVCIGKWATHRRKRIHAASCLPHRPADAAHTTACLSSSLVTALFALFPATVYLSGALSPPVFVTGAVLISAVLISSTWGRHTPSKPGGSTGHLLNCTWSFPWVSLPIAAVGVTLGCMMGWVGGGGARTVPLRLVCATRVGLAELWGSSWRVFDRLVFFFACVCLADFLRIKINRSKSSCWTSVVRQVAGAVLNTGVCIFTVCLCGAAAAPLASVVYGELIGVPASVYGLAVMLVMGWVSCPLMHHGGEGASQSASGSPTSGPAHQQQGGGAGPGRGSGDGSPPDGEGEGGGKGDGDQDGGRDHRRRSTAPGRSPRTAMRIWVFEADEAEVVSKAEAADIATRRVPPHLMQEQPPWPDCVCVEMDGTTRSAVSELLSSSIPPLLFQFVDDTDGFGRPNAPRGQPLQQHSTDTPAGWPHGGYAHPGMEEGGDVATAFPLQVTPQYAQAGAHSTVPQAAAGHLSPPSDAFSPATDVTLASNKSAGTTCCQEHNRGPIHDLNAAWKRLGSNNVEILRLWVSGEETVQRVRNFAAEWPDDIIAEELIVQGDPPMADGRYIIIIYVPDRMPCRAFLQWLSQEIQHQVDRPSASYREAGIMHEASGSVDSSASSLFTQQQGMEVDATTAFHPQMTGFGLPNGHGGQPLQHNTKIPTGDACQKWPCPYAHCGMKVANELHPQMTHASLSYAAGQQRYVGSSLDGPPPPDAVDHEKALFGDGDGSNCSDNSAAMNGLTGQNREAPTAPSDGGWINGGPPSNYSVNHEASPYTQPYNINKVVAETLAGSWQKATEKPTIMYKASDGTWAEYNQRAHTKLPRHTPVCLRLKGLPPWPADTAIFITPTRRDDIMTDQQKADGGNRQRQFQYDQIVFAKIGQLSEDESHPEVHGWWGGQQFAFRYAPDTALGSARLRKTVNHCACGMFNMKQDHHEKNHHHPQKKAEAEKRRIDGKAMSVGGGVCDVMWAEKTPKHDTQAPTLDPTTTSQTPPPSETTSIVESASNSATNAVDVPANISTPPRFVRQPPDGSQGVDTMPSSPASGPAAHHTILGSELAEWSKALVASDQSNNKGMVVCHDPISGAVAIGLTAELGGVWTQFVVQGSGPGPVMKAIAAARQHRDSYISVAASGLAELHASTAGEAAANTATPGHLKLTGEALEALRSPSRQVHIQPESLPPTKQSTTPTSQHSSQTGRAGEVSIAERLQLVDEFNRGTDSGDPISMTQFAHDKGILPSTFQRWHSGILRQRREGKTVVDPAKKRNRPPKHHKIEDEMRQWMAAHDDPESVRPTDIRTKALEIAMRLRITGFSASDTWVRNFKKRCQQNCPWPSDGDDPSPGDRADGMQTPARAPPTAADVRGCAADGCMKMQCLPSSESPAAAETKLIDGHMADGSAAMREPDGFIRPIVDVSRQTTTPPADDDHCFGPPLDQQSQPSEPNTISMVPSESRLTNERPPNKIHRTSVRSHRNGPPSVVLSRSSVKSAVTITADDRFSDIGLTDIAEDGDGIVSVSDGVPDGITALSSRSTTDGDDQSLDPQVVVGSSLSENECAALHSVLELGMLDECEFTLLYRASRDGPSYADLLRCAGDLSGLVFVMRLEDAVFGAYVSGGLQLPDDPTAVNEYPCDVWHFSLCGHFDAPAKVEVPATERRMYVAGREGAVDGGPEVAKLAIGFCEGLWLGWADRDSGPAEDMYSCSQFIHSDDVPEGYVGVRGKDGSALFGGSEYFMADEVEVLRVDGRTLLSLKVIDGATFDPLQSAALYRFLGPTNGNKLSLIYRATRDGPSYADLLRSVGDASGLVFVIHNGQYVFGAYVSGGLQLPDDQRGNNRYSCDVWHFSLSGHFAKGPTKVEGGKRAVWVAGREGTVSGGKLVIALRLWLGYKGGAPDDMRSCRHFTFSDDVPAGYVGVRDEYGDALFGGSEYFMADEVEVLTVV
ncbi:unnamed protein product [Vitrella brassicaformis CCMP3155]|uniref:HTH CENPB-type domain-containing protein n=4 Tax=Vitrella brassicaformis TaxID=1169539 RepID=A0A0G4GME4_VITBC|nr:unnamed protein product [Vitrella brassicaformis CCMP3155]|eukprot:CEM31378.1 unnamed protein product [Vitrella brassicaformis CCMP3155]